MQPEVRLRISVLGLFVDADEVLLLHQMTPPEPDLWDLPGGGMEPHESLMDGLAREILEETGITEFQVEGLLTLVEGFHARQKGGISHTIGIIYQCSVPHRPAVLSSDDPEVGPKGIQWLPIASLDQTHCTSRTWKALQAAGLVK
ncbi:MAG TPA: NUDIX hydrolase [Allocoleopsis sp.]